MTREPGKPGAVVWAAVLLVLAPVFWPLSWGPYYRVKESGLVPRSLRGTDHVYDPLRRVLDVSPEFVSELADQYLTWWFDGVELPEPWRPTSSVP